MLPLHSKDHKRQTLEMIYKGELSHRWNRLNQSKFVLVRILYSQET